MCYFNESAVRILGCEPGEVLGQSQSVLMPPRFHTAHEEHIRMFDAGDGTARRMSERSPIFGRRKNGEDFSAEAAIARVVIHEGTIFAVVMWDGSEQRRRSIRSFRTCSTSHDWSVAACGFRNGPEPSDHGWPRLQTCAHGLTRRTSGSGQLTHPI